MMHTVGENGKCAKFKMQEASSGRTARIIRAGGARTQRERLGYLPASRIAACRARVRT